MLKLYVACFPPDKRKGRFLRHLKRRNGQLECTEQKFGRHAAQEFPKIIAQALGLKRNQKLFLEIVFYKRRSI
jgi:hypothetical protein